MVVIRVVLIVVARRSCQRLHVEDVAGAAEARFTHQPASGEIQIVSGGSHGGCHDFTRHCNRQRRLHDNAINAIDPGDCRVSAVATGLRARDVLKPNSRPRARRMTHA
jgi:hypothetical protein